jgi:hypothetical protein
MRRILRWGKWVALVLIVVIGAALTWLHTSSGREFLRKRVEAGLAGAFPGSKVGSVTGSVFSTLVVHDIVVQGADGKPLVTVGSAAVEVSLLPLATKTVRVDHVVVSDVVAIPRKQPPKPEEPKSGGSSWSIEMPDIAVHRARVVLPDEEVRDIELAASVRIPAGGALAAVAAVKASWRGLAVEATGYARIGDVIEVPFAQVATGAAGAAVFGAKLGDEPTGDAFARISPALATALKVADLPSELLAIVHARPGGAVAVHAALGDATARVGAVVDLAKLKGKALIIADAPKYGAAVVAVAGDLDHASGMVAGETTQQGHLVRSLIALNGTRTGGWLGVHARTDIGRVSFGATVTRKGDAFELVKSTINAHATRVDVKDAAGVHARAGAVDAWVTARGRLWPEPKVRVDGDVAASGVSYAPFAVGGASARLTGVEVVRTGLAGSMHVEANGVARAGSPLGSATIDARVTAGFDGTLTALIDHHTYTSLAAGSWSGSGGVINVGADTIKVRDFHSSPGAGSVAANATITRASGDLVADVTTKDLELSTLVPGVLGTVSATAHATRRGLRWDATATFGGQNLGTAGKPLMDVRGLLTIAGRHVIVTTSASNPDVGEVRLAAEVDGPYDITDAPAWKRLPRKALRSIAITVVDGKLAGADPRLSGSLEGGAAITADGAHGSLRLHGFHTKAGDVDLDMTLSAAEHGEVATAETVQLVGVASADGVIHIALPPHPFDPASWKALGPRVFADGSLVAKGVKVDPKVLEKFGVEAPYSGTVDIDAEVAEGATGATIKADVRDVTGGIIVKPVSVFLDGGIDELGAHATVTAKSGDLQLLEATAGAPLTVDQIRTGNVLTAPLTGTIAFGAVPKPDAVPVQVPAADALAIIGRRDVSAGTIEGVVTIGGTIAAPTGTALLTTRDLTVPASIEGRPPAKLADMVVKGSWNGLIVNGEVIGHEGKDGVLHLTINGPPKDKAKLIASLESVNFDIAPFSVFMPGPLAGARGTLDGSLKLAGLDPVTGDLKGILKIHKGRLPLQDMIGTLRNGEVDIQIANHKVNASLTGQLGRGSVKGRAEVELSGSTPKTAKAKLEIRQVSLIRAHQPQIDADVSAKLEHSDKWTGTITVTNGRVFVPPAGGQALLDSYTPGDMVFVDGAPPKLPSLLTRQPPSKPWLVTDIDLQRTTVDVEDDQYNVKGAITGHLTLSLGGDGIGLDGAIDAERGDIQLLGQRSQLDHGSVVFDGTIDPLLNVRVIRDLTDLTVTCEVDGRLSKPDIKFSSDSGNYSQGDLLALFVGGQAGGDHSDANFGQAAATAGAGLASNVLTKKLLRRFPIQLDLHYTPGTDTTSDAYGISKWVGENLYVEARHHPEARVDENANEVIGEYHLGRHTLFSGDAGDRGYAGGDLVFSFHW